MKRVVMVVMLMALVFGVVGVAAAENGGRLPGLTLSSRWSYVTPMENGGRLPTLTL